MKKLVLLLMIASVALAQGLQPGSFVGFGGGSGSGGGGFMYVNYRNTWPQNTTAYVAPGYGTSDATAANRSVYITTAGTIQGLLVAIYQAPVGCNVVFTLQKNGANQAVTVTVPAGTGNTTFSDVANSFSVAAGDYVNIKVASGTTCSTVLGLSSISVGLTGPAGPTGPTGPAGPTVYPGAGVANSTGSAWGTSYTVGTAANNLVQLNGSSQLPAVSAALLTNFPTLNQNTTGSAAALAAQYIDWNASSGGNSIANKPTLGAMAAGAYPAAGIAKSTGSAWGTTAYTDIVALWAGGSCSGYLKNDGTCSTSGSMTYPGAGLPISTGSAWSTSLTPGAAGHVVRSNGTAYADAALQASDIPTLNQNTTGTAAGLAAAYIDWNSGSGGSSILNKPTLGALASAAYPSAGVVKSTGAAWATTAYTDIVALWAGGSCSGYLKNDGTCSTSGSMVYPGAGVAISTGSAWGTSITPGVVGHVIRSNGTSYVDAALQASDVPILNQNTTGTAAGLTSAYIDWNQSSGGASIINKPTLGALAAAAYPSAGIVKSTGSAWATTAYSDVVAIWASGSCSGYLKSDGTCATPGGGNMTVTSGAGAPSGSCTAFTSWYIDTTNQDDWFCSATNTWKKNISTTNSGAFIWTGLTGSTPTTPSTGYVSLYFDSTNKTVVGVTDAGTLTTTTYVKASRDANKFVTNIDATGVQQTAAIQAADVPTLNQNTTGTAAGLTSAYIDWNAVSGGSSILNKPTLGALASAAYPGSGIPNSTGSAWGTSYSTSGSGTVLVLATGPSISNLTASGTITLSGITGSTQCLQVSSIGVVSGTGSACGAGGGGLGDPGGNGIVARTALNTTINRTITGTTNRITVTNGDGVSGNPTLDVGTNIIDKTAANSYTAGAKQTFSQDATNSGFSLGNVSGSPSSPASGDLWHNSGDGLLRYRSGTTTYVIVQATNPNINSATFSNNVVANGAGGAVLGNSNNSFSSLYLGTVAGQTVQITTSGVTANRVVNFKDVAGDVVTTGDTGTVTNTMLAGSIALSKHATQAADTVVMNATGSAAAPTAVALPSCSGASNGLTYNTTTHAWGCNTLSGSGTVTVVGAGSLTSTAIVTGGGTTTIQTASTTSTLDASGNLAVAAGGSLGSADTGTPKFTFAANKVTLNQPLYFGTTSNQAVFGTSTNLTTLSFPASSGAVTVTGPNVTSGLIYATSQPAAGIATFAGSTYAVTSTTSPALGTATATSLLATGIVDGKAPIDVTTGSSASLGGTYKSGYTYNQHATAATAITYTLPTAAAGLQYCIGNSYNGSAANTGTLRLNTSAAGQYIIYTDGTLSASGGYVISGGAAADAACVVGVDATHWMFYVQRGTWTKN